MANIKTDEIELALIDVGDRLREVDAATVEVMAASWRERGQLTAIDVRPMAGGRYKLTAGAHRMAVALQLGHTKIRAEIAEYDDDEARLREIDENLYRAELSPFDQANFLEERRQIWERLHGQVKRGGDRRSKGQIVPLIDQVGRKGAFFKETAERFGLNPKQIKRALTRKAQINPKVWAALRGTEAAENGTLLDKIRKLNLDEQLEVAALLKERGCTVQHAMRAVISPVQINPDVRDYEALSRAWKRASPVVRTAFLNDVGGQNAKA